jgi:hypothetical protein
VNCSNSYVGYVWQSSNPHTANSTLLREHPLARLDVTTTFRIQSQQRGTPVQAEWATPVRYRKGHNGGKGGGKGEMVEEMRGTMRKGKMREGQLKSSTKRPSEHVTSSTYR